MAKSIPSVELTDGDNLHYWFIYDFGYNDEPRAILGHVVYGFQQWG
jgi:hypothetical protein